MNGFALKSDGSYRAVTSDYALEPDETFVTVLPDLSNSVERQRFFRILSRRTTAFSTAKNVPAWATWTQEDWQTYFNTNLADSEVDLVTSLATARVMIKRQNLVIQNLVKMVIALRDAVWADLPE